jgi:opacity protein-like surface antigen
MKKRFLAAVLAALVVSSLQAPTQAVECSGVEVSDLWNIYGSDGYFDMDTPEHRTDYTGGTYVGGGVVRQKPGC